MAIGSDPSTHAVGHCQRRRGRTACVGFAGKICIAKNIFVTFELYERNPLMKKIEFQEEQIEFKEVNNCDLLVYIH